MFLLVPLLSEARAEQPSACSGEKAIAARVTRVVDGRSFVLDNNQEVKLAAIETPFGEDASATKNAKAVLDALLSGRNVILSTLNAKPDRYGRLAAFVRLPDGEKTIQHILVAQGHARVSALIANHSCAAELLEVERRARAAKLGLWADPVYEIMRAEKPAAILAAQGHFALIEGKVWSVRESRGIIYVNFAQRWSEGFAATIRKRDEARFAAAGMDLRKLAGHVVRVRGWVEARGTPRIEASGPSQMELAEAN